MNLDVANERSYPTPYASSPLLPLLLLSLACQKHSPRTKTEFRDEYDYIVVGAGSAGSVVASRLSEVPCVSVLLLEAGRPPPRVTEVPLIARSFRNTDIDWQYLTEPQKYTAAGLVDRRIVWPSGKTLGGSSTINGMKYVRGNRLNYDEWAKLGAKGWSYEDVLPYFKKLEDNTDPELLATRYHAAGGPVAVERPKYEPILKKAEVEAAMNEGYEFVNPNGAEQIGYYDFQQNSRRGQRSGTAKAYLVPAENRPNLDIVANAMVRKVLIENKIAVGVEFDYDGSTRQVKARREVILSAGTTNTAQLLLLSGIGPASELQKHNIEQVADLPVGLNMQDHPTSYIFYEIDSSIRPLDEEAAMTDNILEYVFLRKGPLTDSEMVQLMAFLNSPDNTSDSVPDFTLYFVNMKTDINNQNRFNSEVYSKVILPLENKTLVTCIVQLLKTYSVGTVTLRSADPYDPPLIDPNYFSDEREVDSIVAGFKECQRILNSPPMKRLGAKPLDVVYPGCEEFLGNEDLYLRCIVRTVVFVGSHQCRTCNMGDPNDETTVVDPELRVKSIRSLRVVDASVMPLIPSGNTNIPTIMIGEKGSDIIKGTIECREDFK